MKAKVAVALVLASALVMAGVVRAVPPPAKQYQSSLTDNTATNTATVHILKASKIQIKLTPGNVCFNLKLKGVGLVSDNSPVTNADNANSWLVQVNVGGNNRNISRTFGLANGNITPTTAKQCISLSSSGDWGSVLSAGTPIEVKRVTLTYDSDADPFAVAGVTTK